MKKFTKLAAILLIVAVTMTLTLIPASAMNYYNQATSLDSLGLLRGTGYGYELDRSTMRSEAATMLVRLLGKEQEALAGSYQYPFKDVPRWADKYVGYLYANGLTKGTSNTTFDPNMLCDTKMFTVFVLRSLGYKDILDFTYDGAPQYAAQIGLIDGELAGKSDFLRGDMVAISYSALFQNMKSNPGQTLLDKLLSENAVDGTIANRLRDSYAFYEAYASSYTSSLPEGSVKLEQNVRMQITLFGQRDGITTKSLVTIADVGGKTVIKSEDEVSYAGDVEKSTSYYADGWVYTESGGEKTKYREESPAIEDFISDSDIVPYYQIGLIEKSQNGGDTTYNVNYNPGLYDDMAAIFMAMLGDNATITDIPLSNAAHTVTFDSAGRLKSQELHVTLGVNVKDGQQTLPLNMDMQIRMSIIDSGDHITVTLPTDLDSYQELNN